MSFQSYVIANASHAFVSGISLGQFQADPHAVQIRRSRDIIATDWSVANWRPMSVNGQLVCMFDRPDNAMHYRIDVPATASPPELSWLTATRLGASQLRAKLGSERIAFLGCARNCRASIERSLEVFERLGALFQAHAVAIYENDSTDGTGEWLEQVAQTGRLTLMRDQRLDATFPLRTDRLAYARNRLMHWALSTGHEYICILDLDSIADESFNVDGFLDAFAQPDVWDGVFPTSDGFYYDIYALRHPQLMPDDYTQRMSRHDGVLNRDTIVWVNAYSRQLDLRQIHGWLPVDSAFGGMGIYKRELIERVRPRYVGLTPDGREVCEHVSFNLALRQAGGRLYINPDFVVKKQIFNTEAIRTSGIWKL